MTDINLMQAEADALIAMEKHRANEDRNGFPMAGQSLVIPLHSVDNREQFLLDLSRSHIDLAKVKMQKRGRQVIVLVRLDLGGAPHRNPDGAEIPTPHLHVYREGYGHKWAMPVPLDRFNRLGDLSATLDDFMTFCNVKRPPHIERRLFA